MEKWDDIYRRYISVLPHRPIFQQQGFVEGSVEFEPSSYFYKYFIHNTVDFIGVGNRRRGKPNKETENSSFKNFLDLNNLKPEFTHRQIIKNIDAEYKSASKYDRPQPELNDKLWELSKEWTIRHFGPGKMMGSKIVSKEIAWQEMDKQTSPGWPHNLVYQTKARMVDDHKHMSIIDYYWDMIGRQQDQQEFTPVWQCSEKVEMRSVEKILENKIRTFTSAPVEHSVNLNRMCLDMNNKFYNTNNVTWSFVGANKFNAGFHRLWQRLRKHPNAFELDESAYDSSLFLRAMADQVDIRFAMYAEEEKTSENYMRLLNLYQSIVHTVIIMQNGELTQKHTGNPSGSVNTIVDNTIILFRLLAYAWLVLTEELDKKQTEYFEQTVNNKDVSQRKEKVAVIDYGYNGFMSHVEAALNGDDNSMTVSDAMVGVFNATSIARVWSEIGVVTNTPNAAFGQKAESIKFLSQGFELIQGFYLPRPDTGKVISSIMYNSDVDDPRWHLLRACALRIDSWANLETRSIIQRYIEYLWKTYKDIYQNDHVYKFQDAEVKMSHIMNMWKTDEWIFRLYSNYEAKSCNGVTLAFMIEAAQTKEIKSEIKQQ